MGISVKSTMVISWLIFPLVSSSILVGRTSSAPDGKNSSKWSFSASSTSYVVPQEILNRADHSSSSSSSSIFDTPEHTVVKHTLEVDVCKTDYYQRMCCQRITPEMTYVQRAYAKYGLCPEPISSSYASSTSSSSTPTVFSLLGWTFDDILNIMSNKGPSTTITTDTTSSSSLSSSSSSSSIVSNSIF